MIAALVIGGALAAGVGGLVATFLDFRAYLRERGALDMRPVAGVAAVPAE